MLDRFRVYAVLPASDLQRAKAWSQEKVGMSPTKEDPGGLWFACAEGTWVVVTPSGYAGTAQNTAASFTVTGIEDLMEDLRRRGVFFEEYDLPDFKTENGLFAMGDYKAAWFKDSEGNIVEIAEVPS
ncbi:MAG TPA: VOC family protein [Actinomycetota bacterium]|nr:VOC family protein [Actinomycetota bacterium]